jgi:hypothetical protein
VPVVGRPTSRYAGMPRAGRCPSPQPPSDPNFAARARPIAPMTRGGHLPVSHASSSLHTAIRDQGRWFRSARRVARWADVVRAGGQGRLDRVRSGAAGAYHIRRKRFGPAPTGVAPGRPQTWPGSLYYEDLDALPTDVAALRRVIDGRSAAAGQLFRGHEVKGATRSTSAAQGPS